MTIYRKLPIAVLVLAVMAGCSGSKTPSQRIPSAADALALFQRDVAAAQHHDEGALCASAEFSDQCHNQIRQVGWPKLTNVRSTGVRVVDTDRVVHVCGEANGRPFGGDFPVQQDDNGPHTFNAVFWIAIKWVPNPGQSFKAGASPLQSPEPISC